MPHSIGLGMIGSSELSDRLLKGILRDHVVDGSRIYIAEQDERRRNYFVGLGVNCIPDVSASMLRSEIMILSGEKREFFDIVVLGLRNDPRPYLGIDNPRAGLCLYSGPRGKGNQRCHSGERRYRRWNAYQPSDLFSALSEPHEVCGRGHVPNHR